MPLHVFCAACAQWWTVQCRNPNFKALYFCTIVISLHVGHGSYVNTGYCYLRISPPSRNILKALIATLPNTQCHVTFSPLVFTTAGGMGLTSYIAEKHDRSYGKMLHLIRCRLNFSLLRSTIMCLHGSWSTTHSLASPLAGDIIDLSTAEGSKRCIVFLAVIGTPLLMIGIARLIWYVMHIVKFVGSSHAYIPHTQSHA